MLKEPVDAKDINILAATRRSSSSSDERRCDSVARVGLRVTPRDRVTCACVTAFLPLLPPDCSTCSVLYYFTIDTVHVVKCVQREQNIVFLVHLPYTSIT